MKLCYGLHRGQQRKHIDDIKLNSIKAPVTVINESTNETKMYSVMGGFHGVESCDGRHKPVMSLAIIEQTTEQQYQLINLSTAELKR